MPTKTKKVHKSKAALKVSKKLSLLDRLKKHNRTRLGLIAFFVLAFGSYGIASLLTSNANSAAESDWNFVAPRIRACESGGTAYGQANYQAQNKSSSASGAYQFINGTWKSYASHIGYGQYSRAMHAPNDVQDAVAKSAFMRNGNKGSGSNLWKASYACWRVGGTIKNAPQYGSQTPPGTSARVLQSCPRNIPAQSDKFVIGNGLRPGQSLSSANRLYHLVFQTDGNIAIYDKCNKVLWATSTANQSAGLFVLQSDGNLAVRTGDYSRVVKNFATTGRGANFVKITDSGFLGIYDANGRQVWRSVNGSYNGAGN